MGACNFTDLRIVIHFIDVTAKSIELMYTNSFRYELVIVQRLHLQLKEKVALYSILTSYNND